MQALEDVSLQAVIEELFIGRQLTEEGRDVCL